MIQVRTFLLILLLVYSCAEPTQKMAPSPVGTIIGDGVFSSEDSIYDRETGYNITLLKGAHSYGGETNVDFKGPEWKMIHEFAPLENVYHGYELDQKRKEIRQKFNFGEIYLMAKREYDDQAVPGNFGIEVKDLSEKVTFLKVDKFTDGTSIYDGKYYNFIKSVTFEKEVRPPFIVVVTDGPQQDTFKFRITPYKLQKLTKEQEKEFEEKVFQELREKKGH